MKTVFDKIVRDELISRINTLSEKSAAAWGKMNIYQMITHCITWEEWEQGVHKPRYKQAIIGFIFGKMALKGIMKDEGPLRRNTPTSAAFKSKEISGDVEAAKKKWVTLINEYEHYSNPAFIHDFFGKMTKEEVGILAYKHTDHHLRQFNS